MYILSQLKYAFSLTKSMIIHCSFECKINEYKSSQFHISSNSYLQVIVKYSLLDIYAILYVNGEEERQ